MTKPQHEEVIGFSGHQTLSANTRDLVRAAIMSELSGRQGIVAVTSLAAGGDQIFAECVLTLGRKLKVVIPCNGYETTFSDPADLATYRVLLKASADTTVLPFSHPSEEAYWAAGKRIVDMADLLIAVWDGMPAGGLGGTADIVRYAEEQTKHVVCVWPPGASRR